MVSQTFYSDDLLGSDLLDNADNAESHLLCWLCFPIADNASELCSGLLIEEKVVEWEKRITGYAVTTDWRYKTAVH